MDVDVVHLHWLGSEMISIEDIGRIDKPIVWTLHDMWPFCGAEHYAEHRRWQDGYTSENRPTYEEGIDLNQWVWRRKCRAWKQPMQIVAPSRWLAECAARSELMGDWPIDVIPYPIDTEVWAPIPKDVAKNILGLNPNHRLIVFGAVTGGQDPRKGMDLLVTALSAVSRERESLDLLVIGKEEPRAGTISGYPVRFTGFLNDDLSLRVVHSAADILVVPSRQDNLPNMGIEALACGTPVVAFDTCGLPDIVINGETGWLAEAFNANHLATGIDWVLEDDERLARLSDNARKYVETHFSHPVIARQYRALYERTKCGE